MDNRNFWLKEIPVADGIFEIWMTYSPDSSDAARLERAKKEFVNLASEGVEWTSVTVFDPSCDASISGLVEVFKTFAPTAVLGGRGGLPFSFSATGYRFSDEKRKESSFERFETDSGTSGAILKTEHSTVTTLDAVVSYEKGFKKQVESFYDDLSETLRGRKLATLDFVRSWNFIDSILSRYAEFNEVRDARFSKLGIKKEEAPAWTGIDCLLSWGPLMAAFSEFRSPGTKFRPTIRHYKTRSQCEASSYWPKFSRAVSVDEGDWRRVHVSGTASVSPDGKTLNSDDIRANVAHTMETVRELLDIAGADFSHVVRSYAYFKKPEFAEVFQKWKESSAFVDFPVAANVCDVCRDDWLFEFECVAVVPVRKGRFSVFWDVADAIGNKAHNCRILAENAFPVPVSLAVTGVAARKIALSETEKDRFSEALREAFWPDAESKRYAVRSSSCSEDSASDSNAWAFRSLLDVDFSGVPEAVSTVRRSLENVESETLVPRAGKKSPLPPADFGILVQEYVPLRTFWVAFTCDPEFSKHAMVAEVSRWAGDSLVSWKNLPDRVTLSRRAKISGLPIRAKRKSAAADVDWNGWRNRFRRIESVFGTPQDVEWGISENGEPFVFQSRPITTLDPGDLKLMVEFDRYETERADSSVLLVRNELSETFDEPSAAELEFLSALYRSEAVVSAYARWGVAYEPRNFVSCVAGKTFIDPALERACFEALEFTNPFVRFWMKTNNLWKLWSVGSGLAFGKKDRLEDLENRMFEALEAAVSVMERKEKPDMAEFFNLAYSPVFEANFLAASVSKYVRSDSRGFRSEYVPKDPEPWSAVFARVRKLPLAGNSLSFRDVTEFSTPLTDSERFSDSSSDAVAAWIVLDFLREVGRTVSVICSNLFRDGSVNGERLSGRCPSEIRFPMLEIWTPSKSDWLVLSDGSATGRIVTLADLDGNDGEPAIVFVERLLPSLADSLPESVVAVISRNGGRLSHFAIVARERGLPVFVSPGFKASDHVGKTGSVSGAWFEILGSANSNGYPAD